MWYIHFCVLYDWGNVASLQASTTNPSGSPGWTKRMLSHPTLCSFSLSIYWKLVFHLDNLSHQSLFPPSRCFPTSVAPPRTKQDEESSSVKKKNKKINKIVYVLHLMMKKSAKVTCRNYVQSVIAFLRHGSMTNSPWNTDRDHGSQLKADKRH